MHRPSNIEAPFRGRASRVAPAPGRPPFRRPGFGPAPRPGQLSAAQNRWIRSQASFSSASEVA
ncbi:hypothetical protein GCM10011534_04070 [Pseudooceanicola nanhaiensis]|jgi:hypothetical protein|uniref:Uncharacterized protein n=1 Tax=Pseudooceanicola nanhaiensis TaxID=375761 RepID=A0A917W9J5_9RHOB|nr:hypothetical protein GCM10011534_04070 [Pseudooceanicola nanhaiensis]